MRMRTVHLIVAVAVGLLVALTGLSGTVLTFRTEIDAALNPSLWRIEPVASAKSGRNPRCRRPVSENAAAAPAE